MGEGMTHHREIEQRLAIERAHDSDVCIASLNGRRVPVMDLAELHGGGGVNIGPREWCRPEPGDAMRDPRTGHIRLVVAVEDFRMVWKRADEFARDKMRRTCSIGIWREWCSRVKAESVEIDE